MSCAVTAQNPSSHSTLAWGVLTFSSCAKALPPDPVLLAEHRDIRFLIWRAVELILNAIFFFFFFLKF